MTKKVFLVVFSLFFFTLSDAQEFPREWKFVTLKTPHFRVIVNAEQQDLGRFYAHKLEAVYRDLKPLMTDIPEALTVVVADNTDITNGYATKLPYSHIFIYPVLPGPQDSLGETGDWTYEILAHEYTHSLTFEAVSGVMEPLQNIFGSILSPNLLLPRWWKEGIAVHIETAKSNGGRLRSGYQDAMLRALTMDGGLQRFDLAQINEILPDWPRGLRPYLFGSLFWSEAIAEKGELVIDELHQRHGGRVPYFVETPARDHLGSSYEGFYRRALDETEDRVRTQLKILDSVPPVEGRPLAIDAVVSMSPRISPDRSKLALVSVDKTDRRSLRIYDRNKVTGNFEDPVRDQSIEIKDHEAPHGGPLEDAPPSGALGRIEWFPDGKRIVYDKPDALRRNLSASDLWIHDLETNKSRKLTRGLRAREPSPSTDGRSVLFVGLEGARTWLGRLHLESETVERLWEGSWQDRISSPVELPDGRIIFALRNERAEEFLYSLAPESEPERILPDFPLARFPSWDGEALVFTSAKNGVHNLYRASDDFMVADAISHSRTGVFSSSRDPETGDYYLTRMSGNGMQVVRVPAEGFVRADELPRIEPLFADRYPRRDPPAPVSTDIEVEDYRPGSYLLPRYWLPLLGVSSVNGSVVLEASTSAFDPLKYHSYSLGTSWDAGLGKASFSGAYQNTQTGWPVSLQASQSHSYFVSRDNPVTNDSAMVSVQPDLFDLHRNLALGLSWRWLETRFATSRARRTGPAWSLQYADYGRSGEQISPERGGHAYAGSVHYLKGDDHYSYNQYLLGGALYFSKWLPKRHALMIRTNAVHTPETIPAALGISTANFFYVPDSSGPSYVIRGYQVGHFFGKSLLSSNIEYRFPGAELRRGRGTDPLYLLRWHGAIFFDQASVEGFAFRPAEARFERVPLSRSFSSVGAEARLETTVGYTLPLNAVLGYAVPLNREYSDGGGLNFSIQLGSLF